MLSRKTLYETCRSSRSHDERHAMSTWPGLKLVTFIVGCGGAVLALFGAGAQFGVLLPFSRDMESEADHIGLIYMARAGYNPEAAVALWQRMSEQRKGAQVPEYASTHPSDETRIKNLQKWMPEAQKEYEEAQRAAD